MKVMLLSVKLLLYNSVENGKQVVATRFLMHTQRILIAIPIILLFSSCTNDPLDGLYRSREASIVKWLNPHKSNDPKAPSNDFIVPTTALERNRVMSSLILIINDHYYRYEYHRYSAKSWGTYVGEITGIGLSTAGTLTGTSSTKTLLSALVTAIQGSNAALDKDILQGQTMIAVVSQMRKARATKMLEIKKSMTLPIEQYSFDDSLVDLLEYYYAGTYLTALQSLAEDSAAQAKAAQAKLNVLFSSKYDYDDLSKLLEDYWMPNGILDDEHNTKINNWLEAHGFSGINPGEFITTAAYQKNRPALAKYLGLPK